MRTLSERYTSRAVNQVPRNEVPAIPCTRAETPCTQLRLPPRSDTPGEWGRAHPRIGSLWTGRGLHWAVMPPGIVPEHLGPALRKKNAEPTHVWSEGRGCGARQHPDATGERRTITHLAGSASAWTRVVLPTPARPAPSKEFRHSEKDGESPCGGYARRRGAVHDTRCPRRGLRAELHPASAPEPQPPPPPWRLLRHPPEIFEKLLRK